MVKRQPFAINTGELERNLQQSTGKGVDAFFSQPSPARADQSAIAGAAKPTKLRRRRPQTARKRVVKEEDVGRPLQDETAGTTGESERTATKTVGSRQRDTTTPRGQDTMVPTTVETVRKAVKQVGKEAATHRFTAEEKQAIADIVYTYGRQGYRTSENEIARIGLNWLVRDYQENGTESVLEQVLRALKE